LAEVLVEQEGTQLVCTVVRGAGVLGFVVVDSTVGGRACGGLRMLPDVDEDEIRGLARAMTLKYGLLGHARGGAKAGVRGDPEAPAAQRRQCLGDFGRAVAPLLRRRVYNPAPDMGTDSDDIRHVLEAAGVRVGRRELRGTQTGYYTALTVFAGVEQAARHLGLSLPGRSAAIEGFGKVGGALGELLDAAGVSVVAVSTSRGAIYAPRGLDVSRLRELSAHYGSRAVEHYAGAERIELGALLELPVDFLCPCARHDSLNATNAGRVAARIVCPGANNPVTPEAERTLFERGVLCLPDFAVNCGGVLGGTMEYTSIRRERIAAFIRQHIGPRFARILDEAARQGVLPREVAVRLALRRFEEVRRGAEHPTLFNRLFDLGLELHRHGWVPGPLVAALSLPYFERTLA
jgi:glutamate dehydrogenase (NAD(P)+)